MPWATLNVMDRRKEFVLRAMTSGNFRELCREFKISPRVGYKWRARFLSHGLDGLGEESRRPHHSPAKLEEEVVCRIVRLKERHRHWGPSKLREVYARQWENVPSESSFKRILERCGLTEKRVIRAAPQTGRLATGRKAQAANEVWTVDFKGWWHDAEGRCDPLTVRDEHSRYLLELRALPNAKTETVQACFERLFAEHGLPGAIRSDNGAPFASVHGLLGLSRLSAWWLANGIDLERSRPGCPQDNGAHERMHRDIAAELEGEAYGERQAALDTWRREFNEERPHASLGMQTPATHYRPSAQRWSGTPEQLEYPRMETRRAHARGTIQYGGQKYFISAAVGGWDLGLARTESGHCEVYFARLLLGRIEPQTASFIPTVPTGPNPAGEPSTSTPPEEAPR